MSGKPVLQVNMHDAKTHLSKYVARVQAGETVHIAKAGKVVARLMPADDTPPKRKSILGALRGQFRFDEAVGRELDKEIEAEFLKSVKRPL
jgi:prevent-host-death family protein